MTNRVLLNNVDHGDLRVATGHGPAFGDNINQVLIFPTEFEAVQREYPIFFRKDADGAFQSVALLGLDRDENLFLDDASQGSGWNARYVPAIQQRGPFSIAVRERGGEPMIHVDLDHPRVAAAKAEGEGEPVFLPAGGNSPYLQHVARLLGAIYDGLEISKAMFAAFEAVDLIEPVDVEIKLDDHAQYDLPGLYTISQERFAGLGGAALEGLHRSGALAAAQWVLSSLGNVGFLVELKNRKRART
ncbi:peptide ABC transporter permease [Caulobacter sp. Root1455]|uniref:SapC family protein n=1 Tax=Caulobacter sp. Root1455 TaxID=1736465 RepID=UPI0006F6A5CE|nr:SapC family protein [Caulobacter sp. Root1455]KQZ06106.1 peptide ABC transporter permease [Caulobacter sp. Root1455]